MRFLLLALLKNESGATVIEYGILVGILSVALVTTVPQVAASLEGIMAAVGAAF